MAQFNFETFLNHVYEQIAASEGAITSEQIVGLFGNFLVADEDSYIKLSGFYEWVKKNSDKFHNIVSGILDLRKSKHTNLNDANYLKARNTLCMKTFITEPDQSIFCNFVALIKNEADSIAGEYAKKQKLLYKSKLFLDDTLHEYRTYLLAHLPPEQEWIATEYKRIDDRLTEICTYKKAHNSSGGCLGLLCFVTSVILAGILAAVAKSFLLLLGGLIAAFALAFFIQNAASSIAKYTYKIPDDVVAEFSKWRNEYVQQITTAKSIEELTETFMRGTQKMASFVADVENNVSNEIHNLLRENGIPPDSKEVNQQHELNVRATIQNLEPF